MPKPPAYPAARLAALAFASRSTSDALCSGESLRRAFLAAGLVRTGALRVRAFPRRPAPRVLRAALATPQQALHDHARRAARFTWDLSAELWLQALEAIRP